MLQCTSMYFNVLQCTYFDFALCHNTVSSCALYSIAFAWYYVVQYCNTVYSGTLSFMVTLKRRSVRGSFCWGGVCNSCTRFQISL